MLKMLIIKFFKSKNLILALFCISILFTSCSRHKTLHITIQHKAPKVSTPSTTIMAGAAIADITPPPGMPMAGHSLFSCKGLGVRTKIMARVIYLKPPQGRPVALVQVDLLSGSRIVHHKVAELIADQTDIQNQGLLIAATHNHSGPGNYFGANFYNIFASNKVGFDQNYFDFMSSQIADAVIKAYRTRRPAKIASGRIEIKGVTANRSPEAYIKNRNIKKKKNINIFEAVNPYFNLIRIDCFDDHTKTYKPLAAFSNFSLHPNTNPMEHGSLYNADLTANVERYFEKEVKRIYNTSWQPVHVITNFTHGDCNPYYGDNIIEKFWDFRRLGNHIAAMALQCFTQLDGKYLEDVPIRYAAREIDLFLEPTVNNVSIARNPKIGLPGIGGAQGRGKNNLFSYIPFVKPGSPSVFMFTKKEHGRKNITPFTPRKNFPHIFFLQVIQVGNSIFMPLPWEVTYQAGLRISDYAAIVSTGAGLSVSPDTRYIVVSCSNGYYGYVTTAEEYSAQSYEGGHNVYGPNTAQYIKYQVGHMLATLAKSDTAGSLPSDWTFHLEEGAYCPKPSPASRGIAIKKSNRKTYQEPLFHAGEFRNEPYWSFKWFDVSPAFIQWHKPLVSIEVSSDKTNWRPLVIDDEVVNDSGTNISIHFLKPKSTNKNFLYQAKWYNPPKPDGHYYRFVIQPRGSHKILYSAPIQSKKN